MRQAVLQCERDAIAGSNREFGDDPLSGAGDVDRRPEHNEVRANDAARTVRRSTRSHGGMLP